MLAAIYILAATAAWGADSCPNLDGHYECQETDRHFRKTDVGGALVFLEKSTENPGVISYIPDRRTYYNRVDTAGLRFVVETESWCVGRTLHSTGKFKDDRGDEVKLQFEIFHPDGVEDHIRIVTEAQTNGGARGHHAENCVRKR